MPFLIAVAVTFLAGFTDVRVGDVQSVEVVVLLALGLGLMSPTFQLRLSGPSVIISLLPKVLIILLLVFCGSLLSLRLHLYPPTQIGLLKQPPYATFVRFAEVTISIVSLFIVSLSVRNDPRRFRILLTAYVWAALINAGWGMISFVGWLGGLDLPGVVIGSRLGRMRGFFGEGGPLGVYLAGAILIQIIRGHYLKYISRFSYWTGLAGLMLGLIGSQSKSAILLIFAVFSVYSLKRRQPLFVAAGIAVIIPLAMVSNVARGLNGYYVNFANFERAAFERPTDGNLVNGRLMAAVLLPRIVEKHPLVGVGIGNYSLVRNDPDILRGLPRTEQWDLHGLGLLGYCAELGVPLAILGMMLYAYPLVIAWRSRLWIVVLSSYPLLAALFGVQLNFAYPFVVFGLALSALAIDRNHLAAQHARAVSTTTHVPPVSGRMRRRA